MARTQTWTRNISQKVRKMAKPSHSIVNDKPLEGIKRLAEDLGLIVHGRSSKQVWKRKGSKR